MSSPNTSRVHTAPESDKRTLQRLRRSAGYRSAKEFAHTLDIPESTYSRYERQPATPECAIPLSAAWRIADALKCSIDVVVGRIDIDDTTTLDDRACALTRRNRELLESYLAYLEYEQSLEESRW